MNDEPLSYDGEIWKPVTDPRFNEPLEASSYGRVRRMGHRYLRNGRSGVTPFWSTKKPRIAHIFFQQGYPYVNVKIDGRTRGVASHIIVCTAFNGPRPTDRHEAAHWDGEPMNCTPDNLRWATPIENNLLDKHRHGRMYQGEAHHLAELTEEIVREMRQRIAAGGCTYAALARENGVHAATVRAAVQGRTWKHVT